jgi:hypothetical protein
MKKLRTFLIVFIGMFLFMTAIHILSTPKVNARKAIRLLLSGFVNDKATTFRIVHYKDGEIAHVRDFQIGQVAADDLESMLYHYVTRVESLTKDYKPPMDFIRVELNNGKEQISLDFPAGETEFQLMTLTTKWAGNNGIYYLSPSGSRKIKSILTE